MQVDQATCRDRGAYHQQLACIDYSKRHNNASIVYRAICAKYNHQHSKDWWVEPEKVVKNDHAEIFWNFPIYCYYQYY